MRCIERNQGRFRVKFSSLTNFFVFPSGLSPPFPPTSIGPHPAAAAAAAALFHHHQQQAAAAAAAAGSSSAMAAAAVTAAALSGHPHPLALHHHLVRMLIRNYGSTELYLALTLFCPESAVTYSRTDGR